MPDTPSIVVSKSLNYRGAPETWTNKYHFEGPTPGTRAEWLTLLRAIWDSEKPALGTEVTLVGGVCYAAGNNAAVQMFDVSNIGGTVTTNRGTGTGTGSGVPGDAAIWVRWSTNERNSKNKPIYLRKYFHGFPPTSDADIPAPETRTALQAHGTKMMDGSLPGGVKVCGPQGADAVAVAVAQFTTTRTLKRNARTPT